MAEKKILIVWSNYYEELAEQQLESCLNLLKQSSYSYQIETIEAGTYEIPAIMQYYHKHHLFDGYIPLGLLLKGNTDHYNFIWEHIKTCFTAFTLNGLLFGNGIIAAPSLEILKERVINGERVTEAFRAIDYLLRFTNKQVKLT